jgi:hypothetical protein
MMYANNRVERFEPKDSACSVDDRSLTLDLTSAASQPPDPDRSEYCSLPVPQIAANFVEFVAIRHSSGNLQV